MKTILAIVGEAGVGKDTAASYLSEKNNWNLIHSYTNRPMREGEVNGREHKFVTNSAPVNTFAYTHYGNYDYWTTFDQFKDGVNIYVIDEKGLYDALNVVDSNPNFKLLSLHILASKSVRSDRGINSSRMDRDVNRETFKGQYSYSIINNSSLEDFYKQLEKINIE